ncbi:MAG TPA: hypothetical protein ENG27_00275 [Candidatus Bathyarchaeota archaeon]|nr:hypothetical protein [Candidatus Bathyarchaeota archaeon]
MSKPPVGYVSIRLFAHATEDPEKVLTAAKNLFPQENVEAIQFKRTKLKGHHGNPIIILEAKIRDPEIIRGLLEKLASALSPQDKRHLKQKISLHVDGSNLYLRLDKQAAFLGEIKLSNVDSIRLSLHFKRNWTKRIEEACEKLGITT